MYFEAEFRPRFSDVDRWGKVSYESLLQALEDVGIRHSYAVADKVMAHRGKGVIWVLAQWRLRFFRRPDEREVLTVRTWGRGEPPASVIRRAYRVTAADGDEIMVAEGQFALFDPDTVRPLRVDADTFALYEPEEEAVFSDEAKKLRPLQEYVTERPFALRRGDIDLNGHVHNTRYIEFFLAALPPEVYAAADIDEIRIAYKRPIFEGDAVTVKYAPTETGHAAALCVDEKICALAEWALR